MRNTGAEPPRQMVTPAEFERRLKRAWLWWWAAVIFFGAGIVSILGIVITQREQMPMTSLAGMALVVIFALQRLIYVLRRRPH